MNPFVENSEPKRRQVANACERCRRNHKRCTHHDRGDETIPRTERVPGISASESQDSSGTKARYATERLSLSLREPRSPFFGPSNIQTLFRPVLNPGTRPQSYTRASAAPIFERPTLQDFRARNDQRRPGVPVDHLPMVVRAVLPYLEIESLSIIPCAPICQSLMATYKSKFHLLCPVVDFSLFEKADVPGSTKTALKQAVCLAASKDPSTGQMLILPGLDSPIEHRSFGDKLFAALKISLDIGLVQDQLVLIQILVLMTCHCYGPEGMDEIARLSGQAVHYAYSLGLHVLPPEELQSHLATLACCVWSQDKLVAAITGRPYLMPVWNLSFGIDNLIAAQNYAGFRVLARLTVDLERVLDPCPPGRQQEDELTSRCGDEILPFENIVVSHHAENVGRSDLASLELLHHVVVLLSMPPESPADSPARSSTTLLRARYDMSAARITSIAKAYDKETDNPLIMLLLVPYAVSLSLHASCRSLRRSRLVTEKERWKMEAQMNIDLLQKMSPLFWLAEDAAELGRRAMEAA